MNCHHDGRNEAKEHDDFAIGIYKNIENAETLVGHLPMELSFLLCKYLEAKKDCGLICSSTGQSLLEDGLVVPGKYVVKGPKKRLEILKNELDKKASKLSHMKLAVGLITKKTFSRNK